MNKQSFYVQANLPLAQAQLEYQSDLSTWKIAKELGVDELPEGAVIDGAIF